MCRGLAITGYTNWCVCVMCECVYSRYSVHMEIIMICNARGMLLSCSVLSNGKVISL